ncbi:MULTISPECIES: RHS repeat-associated core domain-containing protein [Pseudomonas]|uniref:RHS repeat-associated core domain-containing protein n=1 Tax=Pseudomonas sp. MIL9 TaxID=2807620 RepID=UPI0010298384|nr:RHS repeat-associated core domain-containing protein [Pseudomonas sp. MIL9]MBM6442063.1 RHS repeat-associated core domain-containing protein [Pseudomonas sp. MIL9]RZO04786.1 hypothetical protein EKG40_23350 [Pseudomonas moorei]
MSHSKQPWLIRYHYDPLDQITSHTLSSTLTRHRFYCKNRLATEIQGAVGYSIVQHGNLLLAQQQHQHDVHDAALLATDLQRSPLHALKKNAQPQPIAYSPYGHRSAVSELLGLLGFNGERQDPVTRHYLLGNYRAFNPVLMRFNSPDGLSPFGKGGLNAYAYCKGDPINFGDRSGRTPSAFLGLFKKISQMPDILENIIQQLPGRDLVSLAQTSSKMRNIVYSSVKQLPEELTGVKFVAIKPNSVTIIGFRKGPFFASDGTIEKIGSGMTTGILPVQLPMAGIKTQVSSKKIIMNVPELANDIRFTEPDKVWTLTSNR